MKTVTKKRVKKRIQEVNKQYRGNNEFNEIEISGFSPNSQKIYKK